jgi:glycosyltransferase involved in cell wall biosynthesis
MAYSFKQLDVWLGASHTEGLGRLSLEAMSAGVAVVTTDTGAEFLRHEENCLLYPPGDPQAGAEAVSRLVQDKDLFIKLVVNGHATAAAAADPTEFRKRLNAIVNAVSEKG